MIRNDHEYQVTREQLGKIEEALTVAEGSAPDPQVPARVREGQLNGLRFQIDDLRQQLAAYEQRRPASVAAVSTSLPSSASKPR